MAELDRSKQADVSAFMFMRVNGQSIRPFVSTDASPGMGTQKMSDLTYFNSAGSQDMLKAVAGQIAHMLMVYINTYYTQQRESAFEDKTVPQIVRIFADVLVDPGKTVHDLAATVDKVFRYKNEGSAAVPVATMTADQPLSAAVKKRLERIGIN
jgi:hypothetical protein